MKGNVSGRTSWERETQGGIEMGYQGKEGSSILDVLWPVEKSLEPLLRLSFLLKNMNMGKD